MLVKARCRTNHNLFTISSFLRKFWFFGVQYPGQWYRRIIKVFFHGRIRAISDSWLRARGLSQFHDCLLPFPLVDMLLMKPDGYSRYRIVSEICIRLKREGGVRGIIAIRTRSEDYKKISKEYYASQWNAAKMKMEKEKPALQNLACTVLGVLEGKKKKGVVSLKRK